MLICSKYTKVYQYFSGTLYIVGLLCTNLQPQFSAFMFYNVKWLPLFQENRLLAGEMILPVMMEPPPDNYSYITPDVLLPGTKWVDNHKGIFTVHLEAVTSVHTQVFPFLRYCQDRNVWCTFPLATHWVRAAVALNDRKFSRTTKRCLCCKWQRS